MSLDDNKTIYGVDPLEIPSAALKSDPGDVVFFHQALCTRHLVAEQSGEWSP